MLPEYLSNDFNDQTLTCSNCGWKGKGSDAVIIDFFGVTKNQEVHCPECDEKIAVLVTDPKPPDESANDLSFQTG